MSNLENKLRLVYDITALGDKCRSGIFFTTLNILKELSKRNDVNVVLSCNDKTLNTVNQVIKKEIPALKFQFLLSIRFSYLYRRLKDIRRNASKDKNYLKKIPLQLICVFLCMITKLINYFEPKRYDVFLHPVCVISDKVCNKKYTILHDLIPLILDKDAWKPGHWMYDLYETLNNNDYYFANSEYTRKDFLKYYPQIDPEKIRTTLLACDEKFHPDLRSVDTVKEKYGIPKDMKYVFSLCLLRPRKNLQRSVSTFVEFLKKNDVNDMIFVLGGGHNDDFVKKLEKDIENFGNYKDKIIKIGYVDDEDLPALYSGAEWFTYTSMYEGFGLPPLEAMSCGCPVIASNSSSLPEVVGNAGILVDWDSNQQHIEAYEKYYFNPQLRKANREKGLARAKEFSWAKCVNTMVEAMKKDCGL